MPAKLRRRARGCRPLCAALFALGVCGASGVQAEAGELSLRRVEAGCAPLWQLRAEQVPLSQALARLGEAIGFSVAYRREDDPLRSLQAELPATALVEQLAGAGNLVMATEARADCPGFPQIRRVVILPAGQAGPLPERHYVPEGMQRYRRAHGLDPLTGEVLPPEERR